MSTSKISGVTIIKPTRPTFSTNESINYGEFMLTTLKVNNSVALAEADSYYMISEGATRLDLLDTPDRASSSSAHKEPKPEASSSAGNPRVTPSSGRFATALASETATLRVQLSDEDLENLHQDPNPTVRLSASTAFAKAAIKRATDQTMIFVNRKTRCVESQSARCVRMELFLYFSEGLPHLLMRGIPSGDIPSLFLRVMTIGQSTNMETRRTLNTKLSGITKDRHTWPKYLDQFERLHDIIEGTGIRHDADYYATCLLAGLAKDNGNRYKEIIREVEAKEPPMSLAEIITKVTTFATQIKDDQLVQPEEEGAPPQHSASAFATERRSTTPTGKFTGDSDKAAKQLCRKFKQGKECHHSPCPYSHEGATTPAQDKPNKSKSACWNLRDNKTCKHGDSCRFSHDPQTVKEAREAKGTEQAMLTQTPGEEEISGYYEEALVAEVMFDPHENTYRHESRDHFPTEEPAGDPSQAKATNTLQRPSHMPPARVVDKNAPIQHWKMGDLEGRPSLGFQKEFEATDDSCTANVFFPLDGATLPKGERRPTHNHTNGVLRTGEASHPGPSKGTQTDGPHMDHLTKRAAVRQQKELTVVTKELQAARQTIANDQMQMQRQTRLASTRAKRLRDHMATLRPNRVFLDLRERTPSPRHDPKSPSPSYSPSSSWSPGYSPPGSPKPTGRMEALPTGHRRTTYYNTDADDPESEFFDQWNHRSQYDLEAASEHNRAMDATQPSTYTQEQSELQTGPAVSATYAGDGPFSTPNSGETHMLMFEGKDSETQNMACIDTGASSHCVPLNEHFMAAITPNSSHPCHVIINTAGPELVVATRRATMWLQSPFKGHAPILLREVLMAAKFRKGLISVAVLTAEGYKIWFTNTQCIITDPKGAVCMTIDRQQGQGMSPLYEFPIDYFVTTHDQQETALLASTYAANDANTWHMRLAHCSSSRISEFYQYAGIKVKDGQACVDCTQAKIHHAKYPKRASFQAEFPGQSFALDYAGPYRTRSPFGHRYMCLLVDVASRYITLVAATHKHELTTIVDAYIELVERMQQPRKVVTIVSDGALCDKDHLQRLKAKGITVLIVAPGSSRLNGKVERRIRTVTEGGRAMNLAAGLPPNLFITACQYCATIQNFIPLRATINGTNKAKSKSGRALCPLEIWTPRDLGTWRSLLSRIRVYGCLAFALLRNPDKQVVKAERAILLGLAPNNLDAYFLMSLETKRFFVSRDVVCHEMILPFKKQFELPALMRDTSHPEEHGELDTKTEDDIGQPSEHPETPHTDGVEEPNAAAPGPAPTTSIIPSTPTKPTSSVKLADNHAPNKRLSFSAAIEPKLDRFEERKGQGTGDQDPGPRTSPAKLHVGERYSTVSGDTVLVHEINSDGDVQVTFPDHPEEDPNELYTVNKEEILDPIRAEEVLIGEQAPAHEVHADHFSWMAIESAEGELWTAHPFTASFQPRHEALSISTPSKTKPAADFKKMKSHHGQNDSGTRRTQAVELHDLVGKVPADSIDVPRTHYQLKDSSVRALVESAQQLELETLIRKGVFQNAHSAREDDIIIPTMFVNRAKADGNGMLAKIKARLTLRGDLDKTEATNPRRTYAPVLLPSTLRVLLSLHCQDLKTNFHQLDHEAAFVSARAKRRIVVRLPAGYHGPGPMSNAVHVLDFNLYGADDAPLVYMNDLVEKHVKLGFNKIFQDHCYLEIHRGNEFIKMVFHVDDFCIAQRGDKLWTWYLRELNSLYSYTVAPLSFYLGMRFHRDTATGTITMDQEGQIDKMVRAFGITDDNKPCLTPITTFSESDRPRMTDLPSSTHDKAQADKYPYRQAVGHLNYLAQCTHLEITLPTRIAAAFMTCWGTKHWAWVKTIMRYLKSKTSKHFTIRGGAPSHVLTAWSDSDHAGNPDNRKSMAAHIIFIGPDPIEWYARTESIVAHSSAESELMALDACARQVQHFRWLLQSLQVPQSGPSVIFMDCSGTFGMAENPIQNRRNRHIHARYFYVRTLIDEGTILLTKVNSEDNLADLLATYKDKATFVKLLDICKPQ